MVSVDAGVRLRPARAAGADLTRRLAVSASHTPAAAALLEDWIAERRRRSPFEVVPVPFAELDGWGFAPGTGNLVHDSGRFFAVEGIHVTTDGGQVPDWRQPILDQPDRAILGIVAKDIDGVLHFLMQAKMEPGNVTTVQISPTVQATPSNYLRAHKGARTRYLEYFMEPGRARVLVDVLQSEQGSWFRGKRNRNMVMEAIGDVPEHPDFIWLTLGQIFELLRLPNVVNMDARTVLSCLPLAAAENGERPDGFAGALRRSTDGGDELALYPSLEVGSWLTGRKAGCTMSVRRIPLDAVASWERDARRIYHPSGKFFEIVGVRVRATNREVGSWCQPLLAPVGTGLVAFVVRRIAGVLHVLARADSRPGYRDVVELGPTVQCTPANFADVPERRPEYLDLVLSDDVAIRYDVEQSEEGGRFHHAVTRHLVVEVAEDHPLGTSPDYLWVTLAQLKELVRASYQVNIEARSLLLCMHTLC